MSAGHVSEAGRAGPFVSVKAKFGFHCAARRVANTMSAMRLGPQLAAELQHFVFFHDQLNAADVRRAKALLAQLPGEGA